MPAIQLDLFPLDELDRLRLELKKVKDSSDNVRRGIFARHGEIVKMVNDIKKQNDLLLEIIQQAMNPKPVELVELSPQTQISLEHRQ